MVTSRIKDTERGFLITNSNIPNQTISLRNPDQQLHCCDLNLLISSAR